MVGFEIVNGGMSFLDGCWTLQEDECSAIKKNAPLCEDCIWLVPLGGE